MDAPRSLQPTAGQLALADALIRGEQSLGTTITTVPASVYIDPDRFAAEQANIFGKLPLLLAPSALLSHADRAVTHDDYGVPVIVSRDHDGTAHVLANVCRHRGTRLLTSDDEDPLPATRIVCPYHAWTYRSDGSLLGLPRAECFPGLDKNEHGLMRFPTHECGGLIWFSRNPDDDFSAIEPVCEDFDAFGVADHFLYKRKTHEVAANWKMVIDAFLEAYHVQRLHASTIASFFADGITVADRIADHQRAVVGRADYLVGVDCNDWPALRRAVTFTYHLFPNTIVVVSPDYINIMVVTPQSVGHCLVEDFMLIAEEPQTNEAEAHWKRSWDLLDGATFAGEDFAAAELCYRGLVSGLQKETLLGTLEAGLADFHARVDSYL
ncbi:MAG: aromatic ring-hydroxylating dioxygenase subunit alpha [Sphingomicrobium sp.]